MDKYDVVYCKVMIDEFEVKSKTKYEVDTKSDTERDVEDAGDKIKAGAKAVANKIKDPDRDLGTEYNKEKIKEKVDQYLFFFQLTSTVMILTKFRKMFFEEFILLFITMRMEPMRIASAAKID